MRNVAFSPVAFQEYNEWFETNSTLVNRIKTLIRILTVILLKELENQNRCVVTGTDSGADALTSNTG